MPWALAGLVSIIFGAAAYAADLKEDVFGCTLHEIARTSTADEIETKAIITCKEPPALDLAISGLMRTYIASVSAELDAWTLTEDDAGTTFEIVFVFKKVTQ